MTTPMPIYTNDDRDYSEVIEEWVRIFYSTMDEDAVDEEDLQPGDESGEAPFGVKIIFDGYGMKEWEDENGEYQCDEQGNKNMMSFAVFVHQNSLTEEFPPHDLTPWALIHRPKEEVCIYAWFDLEEDQVDIIPFEDNNSTELDHEFITDLIFKIQERDKT